MTMPSARILNDRELKPGEIAALENADEIAHFFARLGYNVDERTNIPEFTILGMGAEKFKHLIHKIELIGKDPVDGDLIVYLMEVHSMTASLRHAIARSFRERPENALLVLTVDYDQLEFVLLERILLHSRGRQAALKQAIRPIPLLVSRHQPDPVALRVLRRFTFTEEDSAYQWEKLRSAYKLAEWSEEYFNNLALFSDYYLKERLTDPQITPSWDEDVRPIGKKLFTLLSGARERYTRQGQSVIHHDLFEPIFDQLGFEFESPKGDKSEGADYLLYAPGDRNEVIAAAITCVWNRNLDDVDESRELDEEQGGTPFEIPGARVVSLLERQVAPWVIVTNGKLWRLYSATAINKATNYYELDLEEALVANDQTTALKYWWLFFREQAFSGFLDELLRKSREYAKELGDRLKDRTFVEVFPQFAKGFIADVRAKGVTESNIDLDAVFGATMTLLYRLMFVLYAESLDLLPVHEAGGYREQSLDLIKREIARIGGTIQDKSAAKLEAHYAEGSASLYGRFAALCAVIDQGSEELNLPAYDGGLFSPDTDAGFFLAKFAIPDSYLAIGLDRLTRDIDNKTQALVFVDFKSLGVRQLGSIYEGLLEFKLRIAPESLAVTREKGREVYRPIKKVKKPLATLPKGAVYLENDKRERKASGSYYTPDYIVKYIVSNTVGPVLDRKFEGLKPRLHQAQKQFRKHRAMVVSRGNDQPAELFWRRPEMQTLRDDCLDLRVLDPAIDLPPKS